MLDDYVAEDASQPETADRHSSGLIVVAPIDRSVHAIGDLSGEEAVIHIFTQSR